jgi:hypothetical protein
MFETSLLRRPIAAVQRGVKCRRNPQAHLAASMYTSTFAGKSMGKDKTATRVSNATELSMLQTSECGNCGAARRAEE